MKFLNKHYGLFIILILSFWAVKSLFMPGFFPMHDDTQVARVFEMGKALKNGMFPVRWVLDLGYGYGYPIFNFYAPLAYYIGGFFSLLGFDALSATKIMMGLGIVMAGIFMYFFSREIWGKLGGIVSGLFYLYVPYHALDIYVRGDVAEFWAYAFIPLAFYGIWKVYKEQKWKYAIIGALGYAGLILSHNLTAMMVTPFLFIITLLNCYIAQKGKKLSALNFQLSTLFLGLFLSAFYWIPALWEMGYTNVLSQIGGRADFRDHFVCITQLWDSAWGFGGSAKGCIDGLSLKIGKLHLIVVFLALVGFFLSFRALRLAQGKLRREVSFTSSDEQEPSIPVGITPILVLLFSVLGFLISVLLILEISKPVWEAIPIMAFFQYPWRFLLLTSFFTSLIAGSVLWLIGILFKKTKNVSVVSAGVLLFFLLFFNIKLFQPQTVLNKNVSDFTSVYAITWVASKISDEYLPVNIKRPRSSSDIPKKNPNAKSVVITVETHRNLFENYKDQLPSLLFEETSIEKTANFLSIIGIGILIIGIIYERKGAFYEKYVKKKR